MKKLKDYVLKQSNDYLDISKYNVTYYSNCIVFDVNKDFVNSNIMDFTKELNDTVDVETLFNYYNDT